MLWRYKLLLEKLMINGGVGLRRLRVLGVRAILVPVVLVTVYSRDICIVYVCTVSATVCAVLPWRLSYGSMNSVMR